MKKLLLLALFAQFSFGQTLTTSGTTYELTGSEILTITNSWTEGFDAGSANNPFINPPAYTYYQDHGLRQSHTTSVTFTTSGNILYSDGSIRGHWMRFNNVLYLNGWSGHRSLQDAWEPVHESTNNGRRTANHIPGVGCNGCSNITFYE